MLRVGLKFPVNGLKLNRIQKHGFERIYLTARSYETKPKFKIDDRLFKDTNASRLSASRYSTESRSEKRGGSAGTMVTVGALTIGAIGILTYAKTDKDFRATLEGWLPGTDNAIKIIFQEESSYLDYILSFFESLKNQILDALFGKDPPKPGQTFKKTVDCKTFETYDPPKPAFTPSALELSPKPPISEKPTPELRLSKEKGTKIEVVTSKPAPVAHKPSGASQLYELEKNAGELAKKAITSFKQASCAVQNYNKEIVSVVESSDSTVGNQIWDRLKVIQDRRVKALEEAEKTADKAVKTLKELQSATEDPKINATAAQKTITAKNISKILADVDDAKKNFEEELSNADLSEKYWKSVRTARDKFHDELEILFPNINIHDKKFAVNEEAFDLFVLHMYHKVSFLQKELEKMQTIADAKLKAALKSDGEQEKIQESIALDVSKEKIKLQEDFERKLLAERKVLNDEMLRQMTLQAQVHTDHLRETVAMKDREAERKIKRALSEQDEAESIRNKSQLASVMGRLKGLDEALKTRVEAEKNASEAQLMWGACQALVRAVKAAPPGTSAEKAVRPLDPEIQAIAKAARKDDDFVTATINAIPEEAATRGVYPEDALRERFLKVEQMARKLALVPEEGASLPIYFLSYLQSFLLVKAISPIPKRELNDEPIDATSLNTYEVLQRARYWLDRGDFKMTLRYMNLLKGAPRSIARDWMNEARILLETQQAVESLVAYAGAGSLVFMGGGETKEEQKKKKK